MVCVRESCAMLKIGRIYELKEKTVFTLEDNRTILEFPPGKRFFVLEEQKLSVYNRTLKQYSCLLDDRKLLIQFYEESYDRLFSKVL